MQAYFIEQISNTTGCPQPRNELIVRGLLRKFDVISEFLRLTVHRPFQYCSEITAAGVTSDQHQLLSFEEIRQWRGIQFRYPNIAREPKRRICQSRLLYFRETARDFQFKVLVWQHILAESACFLCDPIQKM